MLRDEQADCLERVHEYTNEVLHKDPASVRTLPSPTIIRDAESELLTNLPEQGRGLEHTTQHLLKDVTPGLNASSLSSNYYGFVTGGVTPAARVADRLVTLYDQNPQVHLPDQTVASTVEDRALRLLMQLLRFDPNIWSGVFTTGATAGNVHGLLLGREYVINQTLRRWGFGNSSAMNVGAQGLLAACRAAKIQSVDIYTTMPHSSLLKAASVAGIGRCHVHDIKTCREHVIFDPKKLVGLLESRRETSVAIIVVSCGEVNTGMFATNSYESVSALRSLCDRYGAWLHVDGAFGIFARTLHGMSEFEGISQGAEGLELADSIAGDGHKMLNVPYDCGFFFCRHKDLGQEVFLNANAAYLSTGSDARQPILSPLNLSIENSRRFRGYPVYATLMAYGRDGYREMLVRQIRLARAVASYLCDHEAFELLPNNSRRSKEEASQETFILVLFKAKAESLNADLVNRINRTCKIYVSGTIWDSQPAVRMAVANWQVDPERNFRVVQNVLEEVTDEWLGEQHGT